MGYVLQHMKPFFLLCALLPCCGGAADGPLTTSAPSIVVPYDAGVSEIGDAASGTTNDASSMPDADASGALDAGIQADVQTGTESGATRGLCCVVRTWASNAASCKTGTPITCADAGLDGSIGAALDDDASTFNSAYCNSTTIGDDCIAWQDMQGGPGLCNTSEHCCEGNIAICP